MKISFEEKLVKELHTEVKKNESMKSHTSFGVGGYAEYFITPEFQDFPKVLQICREYEIPYLVIGNGSNLLVSDNGIKGAVIACGKNNNEIAVSGNRIIAGAGATLAMVAKVALDHGLTGMECLGGIPGTVGGAVVMNAGAYGGDMSMVLEEVIVCNEEFQMETRKKEALELSYRHSKIMETKEIVLRATFLLQEDSKEDIKKRMEQFRNQRLEKQPLEYKSAGSTFKRPEGYFAGKLIMDAGLRGMSIGDAQVSEKHCGFIINRGNATATDINRLMKLVVEQVEEKFQVTLEPEVRKIGEFQ